jgi:hypothetical protein
MVGSMASTEKVTWAGRVVAVQPRIRLTRSFDERWSPKVEQAVKV